MRAIIVFFTALLALGLSACSLMPRPAFPREHDVNINRFMGPWYVIAHIPPSKTKNAYDVNKLRRVPQQPLDQRNDL